MSWHTVPSSRADIHVNSLPRNRFASDLRHERRSTARDEEAKPMPRVRDRDNSRGGLRAPDAAIARHVVRRVQPDEAGRRRSRIPA
jgi:hypothetical protein